MKKYIIIIAFIIALTALEAFDGFVPADEMTGKYLKVKTCYQKSFNEFDNGFNYFGLIVTKPNLYKKFSLGFDITGFGDDIFKTLTFNLSSGYTFKEKWIVAISGGVVQRSLDTGSLIFNEVENIADDGVLVPNVGISIASNFYKDKLNFKIGIDHINQPDISFHKDGDKIPIKLFSELNWQINKKYRIGTSFSIKDNQYYAGLNFGIKFPYPIIEHNFKFSSERISYQPEFTTFKYWNVRLAYNYYLDSKELGYGNYGICLSYQYPGNTAPVIKWINEETQVDTSSYDVNFEIVKAERLKQVAVKVNEKLVYQKNNIWEHESKRFSIPVTLSEGDNSIAVEIQPVNGSVYTNNKIVRYEKPIIPKVDTVKVDTTFVEPDTTKIEVEEKTVKDTVKTEPDAIMLVVPADSLNSNSMDYVNSYYTVKNGDCLWNIAKNPETYNDAWKWKVIYKNNADKIKDADLIYPGQKFLIVKEKKGDNIQYYIVKKGDCLWNIAKMENFYNNPKKWKVIYFINKDKIKDPNIIYPGQNLKIIIRNK